MESFDRKLFYYENCLNCALLPNKTCPVCFGSGLIIRRLAPHPRPVAQTLQELLMQIAKDIDLCTIEEEDAKAIGDRAMVIAIAGRRAGLALAGMRLQSLLLAQSFPMPRGRNGAVN